ncbi:FkbM family methyltransferase [Persicitalea sp.]|uniref:FkbM family methyltransferase n=1 Tax=Persicitalea sp. TaxID=3100273 RepID=UPI00359476AC
MNLNWTLYRLLSLFSDKSSYSQLLRYKHISVSSFLILRKLHALVPELKTIVDVGANQGQFCIAARHRFPQAAIHSYEPVPDTFKVLSSNVGKAGNIQLNQLALGHEEGVIPFHQNKYSHVSSILKVSSENDQSKYNIGVEKVIEVPISTLDRQFNHQKSQGPVLLKLDVQGYEKSVLEGGPEFVKQVDFILIEMPFVQLYENQLSFTEINDYLNSIGFTLRQPMDFNLGKGNQIIEMDALYQRTPGQ